MRSGFFCGPTQKGGGGASLLSRLHPFCCHIKEAYRKSFVGAPNIMELYRESFACREKIRENFVSLFLCSGWLGAWIYKRRREAYQKGGIGILTVQISWPSHQLTRMIGLRTHMKAPWKFLQRLELWVNALINVIVYLSYFEVYNFSLLENWFNFCIFAMKWENRCLKYLKEKIFSLVFFLFLNWENFIVTLAIFFLKIFI